MDDYEIVILKEDENSLVIEEGAEGDGGRLLLVVLDGDAFGFDDCEHESLVFSIVCFVSKQ